VPFLLLLFLFVTSSLTTDRGNDPMGTRTKIDPLLQTRAERTDYRETSRYDDVMQFLTQLQRQVPDVRLEYFGKTEEGRALPLLILSDPPLSDPQQAHRSGKPVVFVMANIHAGEVEGKEAMLHLTRRLMLGDLRPLLRSMVLLVAPIYNADGNERVETDHRTAQNGPLGGVGTRENARGLDLNRDYMKLESVEARSLVSVFNRWDPHLTVDLHTSNGSYHGYHLTYSPTLNPNADPRLIAFERNRMLPSIGKAMRNDHRFRTYYYGNFATREQMNRESETFELQRSGRAAMPDERPETRIWRTFDHRPMFGNNYVGLRNRLTILSEAYSYLSFPRRVAVTESFVEEILRYVDREGSTIVELIRRVDQDAIAGRKRPFGVEFELTPLAKPVSILVGEVRQARHPETGRQMRQMVEESVRPVSMPDYGTFTATRTIEPAVAYLLPPGDVAERLLPNLRLHGISIERLTEEFTTEVESFLIQQVKTGTRVFQGHREVQLTGKYQSNPLALPAGTLLIRTAHPLQALLTYLLEPESDNGYVRWNFLDPWLQKKATYPIHRVRRPLTAPTEVVP
jgi:hypothetical protein